MAQNQVWASWSSYYDDVLEQESILVLKSQWATTDTSLEEEEKQQQGLQNFTALRCLELSGMEREKDWAR